MLNNPLKVLTPKMDNAIGTDDDLHCIRYSLLVPALAAAYVIALTRSTIALEKTVALFHCTY